ASRYPASPDPAVLGEASNCTIVPSGCSSSRAAPLLSGPLRKPGSGQSLIRLSQEGLAGSNSWTTCHDSSGWAGALADNTRNCTERRAATCLSPRRLRNPRTVASIWRLYTPSCPGAGNSMASGSSTQGLVTGAAGMAEAGAAPAVPALAVAAVELGITVVETGLDAVLGGRFPWTPALIVRSN